MLNKAKSVGIENMDNERFDRIIRTLYILSGQGTNDDFGYCDECFTKMYSNHFKKEIFERLKKELLEKKIQYVDIELNSYFDEHWHKWLPPKMASVASSSRFCYLALKNIKEIEFEKTEGMHCLLNKSAFAIPHLDAFVEKDNLYYEVKCHEIFMDLTEHTRIVVSYADALFSKEGFAFDQNEIKLTDDKKKYILNLKWFELKKNPMFDIKQLLCHLLGIANEQIKSNCSQQATLRYLFFRPDCSALLADDEPEIEREYNNLKEEVRNIFKTNNIVEFCKRFNINLEAYVHKSEYMNTFFPTRDERIY